MSEDAAATRKRWVPVSASAMGTVIEWYDFFLYSSAAVLVFNTQFFGDVSPVVGTMIAFATYAIGFVVRPLGGIVFGNLGDRIGRKPVLLATVLMMGLSTIAIGLLPNFAAIGYWAPALLILLRVVQGFGAGAEYGGAVVVAGESGRVRRGFFTSIPAAGVDVAMMLATGVFALFALLPREAFDTWGWRVPFLLSVVGVGVAFWIRVRMPETEEFREIESEAREARRSPFRELWSDHRRKLLLAAGVNFGGSLTYIFQTFALSYSINNLGYPAVVSLLGVVVSGLVGSAATVAWGALSDRVGRRPVIIGGALFLIAFVYPFFALIEMGSVALLYIAVIVAHVADRAIFGVQASYYAELFPPRVRFSGIATAREVTGALVGGPLPLVATALVVAAGGSAWLVALLVVVLAGVSALSAWLSPETNPDVAAKKRSASVPTSV
ncbi:MFS transporter [Pseudonocardia kunmingensis]|uniref:Putative MFS family arabinose efflux permease n=1 Tax=Pseudonocardia kunmingensis TaxID=630975 RepID=A0A543DWJ8_9PSEU|nr:MFS transporter [Pseudonocardia kunmingensis]TQM13717.1 putative MFS family arabinose efflux permease [Pseudonocardia kunmingensis]